MKAFISYSHFDENHLAQLHKHLAQLQREGLITTWTDNDILAGGTIENVISEALQNSNLFIALLSPDYINSKYCYNEEFQKALELQEQGKLTIVPVIAEPCDWLNTPFNKFKALPKDGKPISEWKNINTAFLNVIQTLRILVTEIDKTSPIQEERKIASSKNYKVQKDFDSIQKMDFLEETFRIINDDLKENIIELNTLDNIQAKITEENKVNFEAILVNRNKINHEAILRITTDSQIASNLMRFSNTPFGISYSIGEQRHQSFNDTFQLAFDEYDMFWENHPIHRMSYGQTGERFLARDIADLIWTEWLKSVGIEI